MKVGDEIEVRSRNSDRPYRGKLVKSARDDPPDTFRMTTGLPWFPERVVRHDVLVGSAPVLPKADKQQWQVTGSKGGRYTVTRDGESWSCTCRGYEFRRACRHVYERMSNAG